MTDLTFNPKLSTEIVETVAPGQQRKLISADNDVDAVLSWLRQHEDHKETFSAYKKESERFLMWMRHYGRNLSNLTHDDMMDYRAFLKAPPKDWVMHIKHPRSHEAWRPFYLKIVKTEKKNKGDPDKPEEDVKKGLSDASVRHAESIIDSMLSWLVNSRYLQANPLSLKRRGTRVQTRIERKLTPKQLEIVFHVIEHMEIADAKGKVIFSNARHKARNRWLIALSFMCMTRISETASVRMKDFECRDILNSDRQRWYLWVHGKGGTVIDVPVPSELLDELKIYRLAMKLPALPSSFEERPALLRLEGDESKPMTRSGVNRIFKGIMNAVETYCKEVLENPELAKHFSHVSAHWMRHSGGTALVHGGANIKEVQEMMRHKSINSTSIYMHAEKDKLHDLADSIKRLPIPPKLE